MKETTTVPEPMADAAALAEYRRSKSWPLPDTPENDQLVRAACREAAVRASAITPPPCPEWCGLLAGHSYLPDGPSVDDVNRFHLLTISPAVFIEAFEKRSADGAVSLDDPEVVVSYDEDSHMTPEQAQGLANDISTAAKRCQEIRES